MKLHRATNLLDQRILGQTTLIVCGVGSLGSLSLELLAYNWRRIVLIDPERLAAENIERHLLGSKDIDRYKVHGARDWLIDRGVDPAKIVTHPGFGQEVLNAYERRNVILLVTVNIAAVHQYINAWCFKYQKPAVYAGIFPNGYGGIVHVIPNPREVCYACAVRDTEGFISTDPNNCGYDMTALTNLEGGEHAVPALRWPTAAIACHAADFVLTLMKGGRVTTQSLAHFHLSDGQIRLDGDDERRMWEKYESLQQDFTFVPQVSVSERERKVVLRVERDIFPYQVTCWDECPMPHQRSREDSNGRKSK